MPGLRDNRDQRGRQGIFAMLFLCSGSWVKRGIDVIVASALLIVLSPVLLVVAASIFGRMGCPVFFVQTRPGRFGKPFRLVKFRTMEVASKDQGLVDSDAIRITKMGRLLRNWSLDELPELINVLRGDMSLVGPRPLLMEYLPLYSERQRRRHDVRPGMTGWAQIHGRNRLPWPDRLELDVWYVENQSILLDLRIIVKTLRKVLLREGVSQLGHATMEPFRGQR